MYRIIGADGQPYGPASAEQLRRWIAEGRANAQTLVQADGTSEWRPLSSFPELAGVPAPPRFAPAAPQVLPALGGHPARTSSMALTGFLCSLLGLTTCCCCWPVFSCVGLILSLVGLGEIRRNPQEVAGYGLAIAGIVLGILGLAAGPLLFLSSLLPGVRFHHRFVF